MRITSAFSRPSTPFSKESASAERTEAVADLFNNPIGKEPERGEVKLRLSHASRRLTRELEEEVANFLKENPALSTDLHQIELPHSAFSRADPNQQPPRKMKAYLQWRKIRGDSEEPISEQEAPYAAIQQHGKDTEIQALFSDYESKRQALNERREKQAPSYYYQAYPEAYSFN